MIWFAVIGAFMFGGALGFGLCALLTMAKMSDMNIERMRDEESMRKGSP